MFTFFISATEVTAFDRLVAFLESLDNDVVSLIETHVSKLELEMDVYEPFMLFENITSGLNRSTVANLSVLICYSKSSKLTCHDRLSLQECLDFDIKDLHRIFARLSRGQSRRPNETYRWLTWVDRKSKSKFAGFLRKEKSRRIGDFVSFYNLPDDYSATSLEEVCAKSDPIFTIQVVASVLVRYGGWKWIVGPEPVNQAEKVVFKNSTEAFLAYKPGTYHDWWLVDDSGSEQFVGNLLPAMYELEHDTVWHPYILRRRLMRGFHPFQEWH